MKSDEKPTKLERVGYTLHRAVTAAQSKRAAKWVVYGATALTTTLMLGVTDGGDGYPKWPRNLGD
jgi:hypothetical protein